MSPEQVVRTLFERVHARDRTAAELYAPDATRTARDGQNHGREAIAEFYDRHFGVAGVPPRVENIFVQGPIVSVLLRLDSADDTVVQFLDVFHVEDGLIRWLYACPQSPDGPLI